MTSNHEAFCLITHKPNTLNLDFLNTFEKHDIYIIVDDNENNYDSLSLSYPKLQIIQIENERCREKDT
jgi:hypothetical protein